MIALLRLSFASVAAAEAAGRLAIDERLAACVNIAPCRSIYRWRGRIETGEEAIATFKTLPGLAEELAKRLQTLHEDELPAIEWWSAEAPPAVEQWVRDSCR